MSRKLLLTFLLPALLIVAGSSTVKADDSPPSWVSEAARLKTPDYDIKGLPAVVLRKEESITVESHGTVTRTVRYVVRILVHEGRDEAVAKASYQTDGEKVRDINAWLIRASGQNKSFGKKETLDMTMAPNDLYNEARMKIIDASEIADTGDVFGFETVTEEHTVFSQFEFLFQDDLPVL